MKGMQPVLLYGTEVLGDALRNKLYHKCLVQVQIGGVLRLSFAYRIVSEPAVMIIE